MLRKSMNVSSEWTGTLSDPSLWNNHEVESNLKNVNWNHYWVKVLMFSILHSHGADAAASNLRSRTAFLTIKHASELNIVLSFQTLKWIFTKGCHSPECFGRRDEQREKTAVKHEPTALKTTSSHTATDEICLIMNNKTQEDSCKTLPDIMST